MLKLLISADFFVSRWLWPNDFWKDLKFFIQADIIKIIKVELEDEVDPWSF